MEDKPSVDDIHEIQPKVNSAKQKKKRKSSIYRESKTEVHTTINGKGKIGRIK
jgi:hypothetical protein